MQPGRNRAGVMRSSARVDKRRSKERRSEERRSSARSTSGVVLVVEGVTWIDDEGSDRRRKVRRRHDRERLAKRILENSWSPRLLLSELLTAPLRKSGNMALVSADVGSKEE